MSESSLTNAKNDEAIPLTIIPGASSEQNNTCNEVKVIGEKTLASHWNDKHYRRLAQCSIICGCSCIGIKALTASFEAERTTDRRAAAKLSKQSRKLSIISIITFFGILLLVVILTFFISYLVTLQD